jgi:hypothetical protein
MGAGKIWRLCGTGIHEGLPGSRDFGIGRAGSVKADIVSVCITDRFLLQNKFRP